MPRAEPVEDNLDPVDVPPGHGQHEAHMTIAEVRQGEKLHRMRYVLAISITAVVIAMVVIIAVFWA